jgi:hypothetical protein
VGMTEGRRRFRGERLLDSLELQSRREGFFQLK